MKASTQTSPKQLDTVTKMPWLTDTLAALQLRHAQGSLAHAYLVSGPRGVGKLALVKAFAASMTCDAPIAGRPCGACKGCSLTQSGSHPDVLVLAPKEVGKGITIDLIRSLGEFVNRSSHSGGSRVAVIAEAHTLNLSAANALLKTLEEPHASTFLFLVSDQPGHLSATIRSRCQKLTLAAPAANVAIEYLRAERAADFDLSQSQQALALAAGAPLRALELLESEDLVSRGAIDSAFESVLFGASAPEVLLKALVAVEPGPAAEQLTSASMLLAKALLAGGEVTANTESLIANLLGDGNDAAARRAHFAARTLWLNEEYELARRQLASSSNPNPKLVLESLCWLTSRAFKP